MLHIRVISPPDLTDRVVATAESGCVVNLVVLPGVARSPAGDLVHFDLPREATDPMLSDLRDLGVDRRGSISVEDIDVSISAAATAAQRDAGGYDDDAVLWDELDARTTADSRLSWAFLAFLALATQLAGIGVLLDQPIIIVGAMVLGPEFGPIAAICFGMVHADGRRILVSVRTLVVGFAVALAITAACAAVSRLLGWIDGSMLDDRPLTDFIVSPDRWSLIVALLAGVAGILSMTSGRSSTLVGVFISVTTVPAAGNMAVGAALDRWNEVGGSAAQLGVNLVGMLISGTLTLLAQRALAERLVPRIRRHREDRHRTPAS